MSRQRPILTIFMPVYNGEAYLERALDSLLAQSFTSFELLVIDDGSADATVRIAEDYGRRDGRIRLIRSLHAGEVAARNKALSASNPASRYFLNHDADDLSLPAKLETLVQYLEEHREIGVAGCLAEYFNNSGENLGTPPIEFAPQRIRATFHQVNSMIHSASLVRREVFETIGGYREEFRTVDDYDFFMRALLAGFRLANIPRLLHRIRLHSSSVGATRAALQEQRAQEIRATFLEHRDKPEPVVIHSPLKLSRCFRDRTSAGPHSAEASRLSRRTSSSSSLRILHTVQMYHPQVGGSEEVVKQLSERLVARGHHVTVATGFHPDRTYSECNGVEIKQFRVTGNNVRGIRGDADGYQTFLQGRPFDVMMNYAAQIWSSDLVFPMLNKIQAAKVFVPCGYSGLFDPAYQSYFEKLPNTLAKYDRVVHLSPNYRDALFSSRPGLTNSVVIGNAASEEEFLAPWDSFRRKYCIETPHLIITVANHYHEKGHNHLLRWFRELRREDVTLAIIGKKTDGGCWQECERAASSVPNVRLFDDLPRKDVVAAYQDADLFWLGSEVECFPLVILESMAAKTAWLSTPVGNAAELAGGWVAESGQMVRKANLLLDNLSLREHLGAAGFAEWKNKYTWNHVVDAYEKLYSSLTSRSSERSKSVTATSFEPRISVIIPCYNQAQYLQEAVESVLAQTYRNFEIIIVNDGSPDDTRSTAERLISANPEQAIQLLTQDNCGLAASRNNGIRIAGGEYILALDADDKIAPVFLEACVMELRRDREIQIVAVGLQEFGDSSGTILCGSPVLEHLAVANQINYCSMFSKALWERAGQYKPAMGWGYEDWDFWISCLEAGAKAAVVPEHLFLYRRKGESMYTRALQHSAELQAQIVLNHPGLYSEASERWAAAFFRHSKNPRDLDAQRILADYYVSHEHWKDAIPHLNVLRDVPGSSIELLFLLAVGWMKIQRFPEARAALRDFLDARPDHAPAHFLTALVSLFLEDLSAARQHGEDALELNAAMTEAYELLIGVARTTHDIDFLDDLRSRALELGIPLSGWFVKIIAGDDAPQREQWHNVLYHQYVKPAALPLLELHPTPRSQSMVRVLEHSDTPVVSVIVPTFNRPDMLSRALRSVLNQTYRQFEIIVINDGGGEAETVVKGLNTGGMITYVRHNRNRGLAAARNTAIRLARGKYVAYLDDDDVYYPEHLQILVQCLEGQNCQVAYTDAYRVHHQLRDGQWFAAGKDVPFSLDFNPAQILVGNFIPVLCIMHEKACFEAAGVFDESLTTHEDWDLWIRFSRKFRFAHVRRMTCEFSWRTDGTTMTSGKPADFLRTLDIIYKRYRKYAEMTPQVLEAQAQNRRGFVHRIEAQGVLMAGNGR